MQSKRRRIDYQSPYKDFLLKLKSSSATYEELAHLLVPEQLFTTAPFMRLRVVYRYYTLLAYGPTSMYRRSTGDYIPISMDRYVDGRLPH
jgi:hypothetical protein